MPWYLIAKILQEQRFQLFLTNFGIFYITQLFYGEKSIIQQLVYL